MREALLALELPQSWSRAALERLTGVKWSKSQPSHTEAFGLSSFLEPFVKCFSSET